MRKGFDSRYITDWPLNTEYEFMGIKISEATGGGPYSQPLTQWQLAGDRGLARLPFHFWRGSWSNPEAHGIEQAEWFFDTYSQHFGGAELPPCIDCEDTYAPRGLYSVRDILACVKRTEELWGKKPLIYSAGWWWDSWIKPYTAPDHEFYSYDLWEADPPPDTPIGYWNKSVIIQTKLDFVKPGYNASIDENEADENWYTSQFGEPVELTIEVPKSVDTIIIKRV